jgi:hypothetical protein
MTFHEKVASGAETGILRFPIFGGQRAENLGHGEAEISTIAQFLTGTASAMPLRPAKYAGFSPDGRWFSRSG